uniref:EF-hand domain-containing protein n=1 Tax=Clastoptera arizonana TaxID=38151 RepID=A0A1B6C848_9HEMI
MASTLTKSQVDMLKKAFSAFDTEKKGSISVEMVGTILEMIGCSQSEKSLKEIIKEVDEDGSGELDFSEFCSLAAKFMEEEEDEEAVKRELKQAFKFFDREGNGYITTEVFRDILEELDDDLDDEELDKMIEEIDADGSGTVDFDEFMAVMFGE